MEPPLAVVSLIPTTTLAEADASSSDPAVAVVYNNTSIAQFARTDTTPLPGPTRVHPYCDAAVNAIAEYTKK